MYMERVHSFHQILSICDSIKISGALVCQVLSSSKILILFEVGAPILPA